jgi:GTP:adenosylcobinamide-phosphate guanylyltransferase
LTALTAVVLAGGLNDAAMKAATGVDNRAMVELMPQKTMLDLVVEALAGAAMIGDIIVVGNVPSSPNYIQEPAQPTFLQNLVKGVGSVRTANTPVLVVTSDIPFITPAAIDDFVNKALSTGADFCYPIISMSNYREHYANLKRTTLKIAEGEFTGGNIMLVNPDYILQHQTTIFAAYAARKDVLKLGMMLGWSLVTRIVLSRIWHNALDLTTLEKGVSRLLGHEAKAKAIITDYASLGTDIDKPEDVSEAKRLLASRI